MPRVSLAEKYQLQKNGNASSLRFGLRPEIPITRSSPVRRRSPLASRNVNSARSAYGKSRIESHEPSRFAYPAHSLDFGALKSSFSPNPRRVTTYESRDRKLLDVPSASAEDRFYKVLNSPRVLKPKVQNGFFARFKGIMNKFTDQNEIQLLRNSARDVILSDTVSESDLLKRRTLFSTGSDFDEVDLRVLEAKASYPNPELSRLRDRLAEEKELRQKIELQHQEALDRLRSEYRASIAQLETELSSRNAESTNQKYEVARLQARQKDLDEREDCILRMENEASLRGRQLQDEIDLMREREESLIRRESLRKALERELEEQKLEIASRRAEMDRKEIEVHARIREAERKENGLEIQATELRAQEVRLSKRASDLEARSHGLDDRANELEQREQEFLQEKKRFEEEAARREELRKTALQYVKDRSHHEGEASTSSQIVKVLLQPAEPQSELMELEFDVLDRQREHELEEADFIRDLRSFSRELAASSDDMSCDTEVRDVVAYLLSDSRTKTSKDGIGATLDRVESRAVEAGPEVTILTLERLQKNVLDKFQARREEVLKIDALLRRTPTDELDNVEYLRVLGENYITRRNLLARQRHAVEALKRIEKMLESLEIRMTTNA